MVSKLTSLRDDLNIYLILHATSTVDSLGNATFKISTVGKLLDEQFNPLHKVTICLFADPKFDTEGNPRYGFYTNTCVVDGVTMLAKSPQGMFEDMFIDNDFDLVNKKIEEYYN